MSSILLAQNINTVAGDGNTGFCGDNGQAVFACIDNPKALFVDRNGDIFIADRTNNRIRKVNSSGIITTIAGTGTAGYNSDGILATAAKLNNPSGVTVDKWGNIYIADENNFRIRKIDTGGMITTVTGTGVSGYNGDSISALTAQISHVVEITTDSVGNVFFCDNDNYRIRKINITTGLITTVAGTGSNGFNGDAGPAISAKISSGDGLKFDRHGNLFFADGYNNRIRMIDSNGIISTVAGDGGTGYGGDGGLATQAQIYQPVGLAVDHLDNIYIAGYFSFNVRRFRVNGNIEVVAGTGSNGFSGDGGPAIMAQMGAVVDVAVDTVGALYVNDASNNRIRKVDNSVAIKSVSLNTLNISVYPNPSSGDLNIYIPTENSELLVEISDLSGRTVIQKNLF